MSSSPLVPDCITTHSDTSSKSQTNIIITMYRLPNVHISQNCIQLLLAIDKTNSRAMKKTPNHWCPSGLSDSDTIFQLAERHCQETCPFSNRTVSLEVLCPFPLGVVALTTSPGRFLAVWDLPSFPYFTVLLPSHGQTFSPDPQTP